MASSNWKKQHIKVRSVDQSTPDIGKRGASYIERINMFPLYSTEYYIQYLLINIVKKKKESEPNKPTKRNKET